MNKLIAILLLAVATILPQNISGDGSSGSPYILYNAADFDSIRILGLGDKYYRLGADIDFSGFGPFSALDITNNKKLYVNGMGYTISNLELASLEPIFSTHDAFRSANINLQNITFDNITMDASGQPDLTYVALIIDATESGDVISDISLLNSSMIVEITPAKVVTFGLMIAHVATTGADWTVENLYCENNIVEISTTHTGSGTRTGIIGDALGEVGYTLYLDKIGSYNNSYSTDHNEVTTTTLMSSGNVLGQFGNNNVTLSNSYSISDSISTTGANPTDHRSGVGGLVGMSTDNWAGTGINIINCYTADNAFNLMAGFTSTRRATFVGMVEGSSGDREWNFSGCYAEDYGSWLTFNESGAPVITGAPIEKPIDSMKITATYAGWDFTTIWKRSNDYQDGYPFLRWNNFISLLTPGTGDSYVASDISITWVTNVDSIIMYSSIDGGFSWTLIDTSNGSSYLWTASEVLTAGFNGESCKIRITDLDSLVVSSSGNFTYLGIPEVTIISPIDSVSSMSLGDNIIIKIETVLVDSISIFYSINDTLNWKPIALNLQTTAIVDTIVYNWVLPYIYGNIYLLATENLRSDTINVTGQTASLNDGTNIPSQPMICWGDLGGNIIERYRYNDVSCGWSAVTTWQKVTAVINDYGDGFSFLTGSCPYPNQSTCVQNEITVGPVWLYSGIDTTVVPINTFYQDGDTVIYRLYRYYVDETDTILYCDDLLNGLDRLVVTDLSDYTSYFTGIPTDLFVYNVQRSKVQRDTLALNADFESLNDPTFEPLLLIGGLSETGRGEIALRLELLEQPVDLNPAYDKARIFLGLSMTRRTFRGVHPKAEKR